MCVSIMRKSKNLTKKMEILKIQNITDNKEFGVTIKSLFSNKVRSNTCVTLNEDEKLIKKEFQTANTFKNFFSEIVPN